MNVTIVPTTQSVDATVMMLVMIAVTATTEDLHLDDTDLDHLVRPIDLRVDTEVTVIVNAVTTNTAQTTVIGEATSTDLAGMIGTEAETVATTMTRETETLTLADTKIVKTEVDGTAHQPVTPDLLVHLAIAKNAPPPTKIVAVTSPDANTIIGVTLVGLWGHPRPVHQQTSLILRNWKKNVVASWQRCKATLQKSSQSDASESRRSLPRRKNSARLMIGCVQTGAGSCLMSISEYRRILLMNVFGVAVVDLPRWRRIKTVLVSTSDLGICRYFGVYIHGFLFSF